MLISVLYFASSAVDRPDLQKQGGEAEVDVTPRDLHAA